MVTVPTDNVTKSPLTNAGDQRDPSNFNSAHHLRNTIKNNTQREELLCWVAAILCRLRIIKQLWLATCVKHRFPSSKFDRGMRARGELVGWGW